MLRGLGTLVPQIQPGNRRVSRQRKARSWPRRISALCCGRYLFPQAIGKPARSSHDHIDLVGIVPGACNCRAGPARGLQSASSDYCDPRVAKHRFFIWIAPQILPDSRVNVIARDDDTAFGILHSRFHEIWSLRLGGWHGVGNDPQYTPSSGFETFPFPELLAPNVPASAYASDPRAVKISDAAKRLNELREAWLNPSDLVKQPGQLQYE